MSTVSTIQETDLYSM